MKTSVLALITLFISLTASVFSQPLFSLEGGLQTNRAISKDNGNDVRNQLAPRLAAGLAFEVDRDRYLTLGLGYSQLGVFFDFFSTTLSQRLHGVDVPIRYQLQFDANRNKLIVEGGLTGMYILSGSSLLRDVKNANGKNTERRTKMKGGSGYNPIQLMVQAAGGLDFDNGLFLKLVLSYAITNGQPNGKDGLHYYSAGVSVGYYLNY